MPAINFPPNPSVNATHTHNGKNWKWNGVHWSANTESEGSIQSSWHNLGGTNYSSSTSPQYDYKYYRITNDITYDLNRVYEIIIDADDNYGHVAIYHLYISQHVETGNHDRIIMSHVSGKPTMMRVALDSNEHVWIAATQRWGNIRIRGLHENEDVSSMPFADSQLASIPSPQFNQTTPFIWDGDTNTLALMPVSNLNGDFGIGTATPQSELDVVGVLRAGNNTSTGGGTALRVQYNSVGDHTANFGAAYSSGAPMIGYAVESSQSASDSFISTADNSHFHRGALVVSNELEFWNALGDVNNIPTVGDPVTMTKRLHIDYEGHTDIGNFHIQQDGVGSHIQGVTSISFRDVTNPWTYAPNHGIMSTDHNGNLSDDISINSYHHISLRLDTNNNQSDGYVRIMKNNAVGNDVSHYFGSNTTGLNVSYMSGNVGINTSPKTDSYRLSMGGHIHMNNFAINYVDQLHFNDGLRFVGEGNDQFLIYKWNDTGTGGIKFVDGDDILHGTIYGDGNGTFGLLSNSGEWAVRIFGNGETQIYHDGAEKLNTRAEGIQITGSVYTDNWFRNSQSGEGLYNEANANHFYSAGQNYWHLNPNNTQSYGGLVLYNQHNTSQGNATGRKGSLYFSTNGFGLLDENHAWAFKTKDSEARLCYNGHEKLNTHNTGVNIAGDIYLQSTSNPTIFFNGNSDAGIDMAIKATPEGLDFYEPEDGNKLHFQILDDTGVNSIYGYKWNGQSLDDRYLVSSGGTITGDVDLTARLAIKKTDNDVSDHIMFYNGTVRVGEIGCHDNDWLRINSSTAKNIYTPRMFRADGGFQVDNKWVVSSDGNTLYENSVALSDKYASKDHIRSLGVFYINDGGGSTTTSTLISELENMGAFDSYVSVGKTGWSYAGNDDLTDAGRFQETAGTSFITWTDNSNDSARGNVTGLFICPTTGSSSGKVFIYNDQGSSYTPGWREVWTNTSDGSGSGLDADLLDGQQGSYYLDYNNLTNTPSSGSSQSTTSIDTEYNTIAYPKKVNPTPITLFSDPSITNTSFVSVNTSVYWGKSGGTSVTYVVPEFKDFKKNHNDKYKLGIYNANGYTEVIIEDLISANPTSSAHYRVHWDDEYGTDSVISLFFTGDDLYLVIGTGGGSGSNNSFYINRIDMFTYEDYKWDLTNSSVWTSGNTLFVSRCVSYREKYVILSHPNSSDLNLDQYIFVYDISNGSVTKINTTGIARPVVLQNIDGSPLSLSENDFYLISQHSYENDQGTKSIMKVDTSDEDPSNWTVTGYGTDGTHERACRSLGVVIDGDIYYTAYYYGYVGKRRDIFKLSGSTVSFFDLSTILTNASWGDAWIQEIYSLKDINSNYIAVVLNDTSTKKMGVVIFNTSTNTFVGNVIKTNDLHSSYGSGYVVPVVDKDGTVYCIPHGDATTSTEAKVTVFNISVGTSSKVHYDLGDASIWDGSDGDLQITYAMYKVDNKIFGSYQYILNNNRGIPYYDITKQSGKVLRQPIPGGHPEADGNTGDKNYYQISMSRFKDGRMAAFVNYHDSSAGSYNVQSMRQKKKYVSIFNPVESEAE